MVKTLLLVQRAQRGGWKNLLNPSNSIVLFQLPVVIDRNPQQEGLLDHHRVVFMPFSEDKNSLMTLPNSPGLFFTTQVCNNDYQVPVLNLLPSTFGPFSQMVSGGEIVIAVDKTLHKFWVAIINRTHQSEKVSLSSKQILIDTFIKSV